MPATTVADIMTEPILTVDADEPLSEVAWAMTEREIRSLAVVDEDCQPLGILTSTDFLHAAADESDPTAHTVGEYMTTDVETIGIDTPVSELPSKLLGGGFNHLPVVSDGDVVGIVSTTDLVTHFERTDLPA